MLRYFLSLSRIKKQLIMVLTDSILLILVVFVAMSLRLGEIYIFSLTEQENLIIIWQFFVVPLVAIPIFFQFGVYRITIRFIVFDSLRSIIEAVTLYSLICGVLLYLFPIYSMPRSVILINWMLSIITIVSIRLIARQLLTRITENRDKKKCNHIWRWLSRQAVG